MSTSNIQKINRLSLRDQIYQTLKQHILSLELPPEQKLNDSELAAQFGVSRTPVREALKRLEDEGLVESFPGAVTRITPLNEQAAAYAFPVAAALHALATRLATPQLLDSHYSDMEAANEQLIMALQQQDAEKAVEADDRFHQVFIEVAGNPEIASSLQIVMSKIRRLELAKFSQIDRTQSPEDHKRIIEACREGKAQQAAELMEQNWLSLGQWLNEQHHANPNGGSS
ncbi:GntR family transcriptional regulator [Paenibacillus kandeliae]|uniref:GntR family transcriptional regulator n=1 Tax=Paenibacillus kandeliae TaxID=3231269 RepID=UPI003459B134